MCNETDDLLIHLFIYVFVHLFIYRLIYIGCFVIGCLVIDLAMNIYFHIILSYPNIHNLAYIFLDKCYHLLINSIIYFQTFFYSTITLLYSVVSLFLFVLLFLYRPLFFSTSLPLFSPNCFSLVISLTCLLINK